MKASDNEFPSVLLDEQASAPTTPALGFWRVYAKSDGLYIVDDAGVETGPLGAGGGGTAIPNLYVGSLQSLQYGTSSVTSAMVADRVYVMKFIPSADVTVNTARWQCSVSSGNLDFGIYNEALTSKLGSTGLFASPGTGARSQALTGSVALTAGTTYYLAFTHSNATFRIPTVTPPAPMGYGSYNLTAINSAVVGALPASVTPTWDSATTYPVFFFG